MTVGSPIRKWLDFRPASTNPPRTPEAWSLPCQVACAFSLPTEFTEALTEACAMLARQAASPGTLVENWTNREGPPAVDSAYGDYMPRVRNQPSPRFATAQAVGQLEQRGAASHLDLFERPADFSASC